MDPSIQSIQLLKKEINQTQEDEHDLAKWKLIVTAALGATALGLTGQTDSNLWLLLFIPFVCAYIDLYDYQYRLRVLVIAKFIREQSVDPNLRKYEGECERLRESCAGDFSFGKAASLGSSIGLSVLGPVLYVIRFSDKPLREILTVPHEMAIPAWLFGIALVIYLYLAFRQKEEKLSPSEHSAPLPASSEFHPV